MEIILDKTNFDQEVTKSSLPVLVDFWAEWCAPCKLIAPILKRLGDKHEGKMKVGKLNVDEHPELAVQFGVRGIPNLKIFKNGQIVEEIVGLVPEPELEKRLLKHL